MSGGSYDYLYEKVREFRELLEERLQRHPPEYDNADDYVVAKLREEFVDHLEKVEAAMKAIEWNDSGDGDPDEPEKILACLTYTIESKVS